MRVSNNKAIEYVEKLEEFDGSTTMCHDFNLIHNAFFQLNYILFHVVVTSYCCTLLIKNPTIPPCHITSFISSVLYHT